MSYLKDMLADKHQKPSSMRLIFVVLGLTFSVAFVGVWTYLSIHNNAISDIPAGVYGLLGVLLLGKSAQKVAEVYGETKTPDAP